MANNENGEIGLNKDISKARWNDAFETLAIGVGMRSNEKFEIEGSVEFGGGENGCEDEVVLGAGTEGLECGVDENGHKDELFLGAETEGVNKSAGKTEVAKDDETIGLKEGVNKSAGKTEVAKDDETIGLKSGDKDGDEDAGFKKDIISKSGHKDGDEDAGFKKVIISKEMVNTLGVRKEIPKDDHETIADKAETSFFNKKPTKSRKWDRPVIKFGNGHKERELAVKKERTMKDTMLYTVLESPYFVE